jgi:histidinol-phosphate aminotransferase
VLQKFWQLWTPNKALGLTGVRAAYVIAPQDSEDAVAQVVQLERLAPSWVVGAHGVAMLQAWTEPAVQTWLAGSLARLRDWKARQIAICESLGWICLPSNTNFFCARPALPQGMDLQQALGHVRAQGIKLRDCTSFGLPGHVRLSVMPPAAQDALHHAWQCLKKDAS